MSYRLQQPQAAALGLAALVTAATLGALAFKADREYRHAAYAHQLREHALAQAQLPTSPLQQVVVVGQRVQQVVVVGRRRG